MPQSVARRDDYAEARYHVSFFYHAIHRHRRKFLVVAEEAKDRAARRIWLAPAGDDLRLVLRSYDLRVRRPFQHAGQTADVVQVVMRDVDALQVLRLPSERGQRSLDAPSATTQAGVHERKAVVA